MTPNLIPIANPAASLRHGDAQRQAVRRRACNHVVRFDQTLPVTLSTEPSPDDSLNTRKAHLHTGRNEAAVHLRHMLLGAAAFAWIFGLAGTVHAQDASTGARLFKSQCSICHSQKPDRNIVGPSLFGVVGRHSGMIPNFHYSDANRASGLVWNPATLDRYLAAPRQVVPGTLMTYPGLKDPHQRADLIAYLATLR
jgi:cytochrome c